ncbi:MAG: Txe/YoeB family addiction module toxin [Candidatus Doudnabacteria bacterium]|nr:Txe/YoeB family addiction module toxin [Candidatus Doudnabacteria bacterium]
MITFTKEAWSHYLHWQSTVRKIVERINMLIKDILRDPFHGIGKPEPLKGQLSGFFPVFSRTLRKEESNGRPNRSV